jgi:DNA-binding transcriptional ArsR family regulator
LTTLYQQLQNPALVQGLAHPLRARMLSILQERQASPKELAAEFEIPLANVAYHIQVLRKLKLIRLVKKTPRRGAVEHHYRADQAAHINNSSWGETPGLVKQTLVAAALEEVGRDVQDAAATGGFDHEDMYLTRSKLVLDQEAWDELGGMLQRVLDRGYELEKEAAKRLRKTDHQGERRAGLVTMLFESMPGVPEPDAAKRPHPAKRGTKAPAKSPVRASRASA